MLKIKKIIFLFFIIFFIYSLFPNILNYKNKLDFYNEIKQDYEKKLKKNIELKTKMANKKSVIEVEKNIRNNLNLTKENEIIIIMPSPKIIPSPTPTIFLKNWQKWKEVFFN